VRIRGKFFFFEKRNSISQQQSMVMWIGIRFDQYCASGPVVTKEAFSLANLRHCVQGSEDMDISHYRGFCA